MGKTIIVNSFFDVYKDVEKRFIKAGINTVNIVAATARKNALKEIENNFTLRNNFTLKGVQFTQCQRSVTKLNDIVSVVGIDRKRGYMERQELGGIKKSSTGSNLVIPHTITRGGNNSGKVKAKYRYSNIKQRFYKRQGNSKMALAVAAFNAAKNHGFIRIDNTIFEVKSFESKRDNRMFVSKPVLNLKHKTTATPKKEWLRPAADYTAKIMQDVFNKQMGALN